MHATSLFHTLAGTVQDQSLELRDARAVLRAVQIWLAENVHHFSPALRERHQLDWFASIELEEYPTMASTLEPVAESLSLINATGKSLPVLAMLVSDFLWKGITIESPLDCPVCGDALTYLCDQDDEIILGSTQCTVSIHRMLAA